MKIRARLIVMILLVGTLPVLIVVFGTTSYMESLAVGSGQAALERIGQAAIYDQALTTAKQIESYLRLHPKIDLADLAALEGNQQLAALAVQPVGKTGYTAVFDANGITHFHVNPEIVGMDMSTLADKLPDFWALFAASLDGSPSDGYYDWEDADGVIRKKYMAIVPVADTALRVAATTYMDEFSEPAQVIRAELQEVTRLTRQRFIWSGAIAALLSLGAGVLLSSPIIRPLREMAEAANQVMQGKWDAVRPLRRQDELGALSHALHGMTLRMRDLVEDLEQQVAERTERSTRRAGYLQAAAEVSRATTSVLDPGELLPLVVELVRERFDLYYVGLFLTDQVHQSAVLRAGTGEAGRQMLSQGHRLQVGGKSMIGRCVATGQAGIQLDVASFGEDEVAARFDNPLLPNTRSELALPLRSRGRVIGAITVQSERVAAFDEASVSVLQTMADQVAVAIENARLFAESQEALKEMEAAQRQYVTQEWAAYARQPERAAYDTARLAGISLGDTSLPGIQQAVAQERTVVINDGQGGAEHRPSALATPVSYRGQIIGALGIQDEEGARKWTEGEIDIVEAVAERMGIVADGLRLLDATQRTAAREQLTRAVIDRVRASTGVEDAVQRAIRELGKLLGAEMVARIGTEQELLSGTRGDGHE